MAETLMITAPNDDVKRSYYAIIPANVRYDHDLPANAKLLYGELTALSQEKGFCWAGDQYFMDLYCVSKSTVQSWLRALEKKGYISRSVKYKAGTKEIEFRYINILAYPMPKNWHTPIPENWTENNTLINKYNAQNGSNSKQLETDFDKLWKLYPNKKGKAKALKAYKRAIKEGATNKEIQDGIQAYKRELVAKQTDKQYIMHGSTFFNQKAWEDEYGVPGVSPATGQFSAEYFENQQERLKSQYEQ